MQHKINVWSDSCQTRQHNIQGKSVEQKYSTGFILTHAKHRPTHISSGSIDFCSALCGLSSWGG